MSPSLFVHIAGVEARKRMSYRADFWINAVVGLVVNVAISYFIVGAIFRESGRDRIGGYTLQGMLFYFVVVTMVGKIVRSTEMEQSFSQDIYEGGLTRFLLYPSGYLTFKYAQQAGSLVPTIVQVLILAWLPWLIGRPEDVHFTAGSLGMGLAAMAVANALYFLSTWPIQAVAFWADNVWSLTVAHRILAGLLGGLMVPLSLFPDWAQRALAWMPFRCLFAFPVDAFLGRVGWGEWAQGIGVGLAWCFLIGIAGRIVWRRGDLQYSGVGI